MFGVCCFFKCILSEDAFEDQKHHSCFKYGLVMRPSFPEQMDLSQSRLFQDSPHAMMTDDRICFERERKCWYALLNISIGFQLNQISNVTKKTKHFKAAQMLTYTILPKVLAPLLMNRFDYFSNFYEYKS